MRNSKLKSLEVKKQLLTCFHFRQNLWSLPEGCRKHSTSTLDSHLPVSIHRFVTGTLTLKCRRAMFAFPSVAAIFKASLVLVLWVQGSQTDLLSWLSVPAPFVGFVIVTRLVGFQRALGSGVAEFFQLLAGHKALWSCILSRWFPWTRCHCRLPFWVPWEKAQRSGFFYLARGWLSLPGCSLSVLLFLFFFFYSFSDEIVQVRRKQCSIQLCWIRTLLKYLLLMT